MGIKRLFIFTLIFILSSSVNAEVIDVIAEGLGSMGHAGTWDDPLEPGELLPLALVLRWKEDSFPGGSYPSYDGYLLGALDLTLTCSTAATMDYTPPGKGWPPDPGWPIEGYVEDNVLYVWGNCSGRENIGTQTGLLAGGSDLTIFRGFYITADGTVNVNLTWGLTAVPGEYADYTGDGIVPDAPWKDITLDVLNGQTTIYVPEPVTIALLGLGGLLLRRRR